MLTIDQIGDVLDNAVDCLEGLRDSWEIPALNEIESGIKIQLHRDGQDHEGRLITDGVRFTSPRTPTNSYSSIYARRRQAAGRQTERADANFSDGLINGYGVGRRSGRNVIDFQDDESRRKAGYLEELYQKELFRPSEQLLEDAVEILTDGFERAAERCFNDLRV